MSAGTSVSGTNRPPNSPKRPGPSGSGPGGPRTTGSPRAGAGSRHVPSSAQSYGPSDSGVQPSSSALPASLARATNSRTLRGVLPARATPPSRWRVDAPGPDLADGLAHVVGVEPAGQQQPHPVRCALGQRPVEHLARPGVGESTRTTSAAPGRAGAGQPGVPGRQGLDDERHPLPHEPRSSAVSPPWSWAPCRPALLTTSTTRSGRLVAEHADGQDLLRQPLDDVADHLGVDLPGAGREHEPTASAPMATARRASSSFVTPQILTNT